MINETRRLRLEKELRMKVEGEVLFDEMSRLIYSTDASLYQIKPLGIILPRSDQGIMETIRIAASYGVPVLPRGGGTSLAGQTVLAGLVVDCSKYLNQIEESLLHGRISATHHHDLLVTKEESIAGRASRYPVPNEFLL